MLSVLTLKKIYLLIYLAARGLVAHPPLLRHQVSVLVAACELLAGACGI